MSSATGARDSRRRAGTPRLRRGESGAAVLEMVLMTPAFLLMVFVVVGLGRLGVARQNIDGAARDAARAGSLARSAEDAAADAEEAAVAVLGSHDITCADLGISVDTSQFRPGGRVQVDLSCTVDMDDLTGMWTPGSKTMTARSLAVVDSFRRAG